MTLLGNFDSMSGQEGNDPSIWNKRSERSMRDQNQRPHQEGNVARTTSHAVYAPPIDALLFSFSCPYKISQQSHLSCAPPHCISHKRGIDETWRNAFQVPIYRPK